MDDKKYTAQEMREMATEAEVIEVADQFCGHDMDTIAAMLRQAADLMEREEREKKYEFAAHHFMWGKKVEESYKHFSSLDEARNVFKLDRPGDKFVLTRREVGEWEEVKDGEG